MLTAEGRTANALGGKTARACESCLRKRARWFCAADDAFLCQSCDSSVHSANQLASRHERVRIETSSSSSFNFRSTESKLHDQISDPVWHHGFTRKARTPRHHQKPPVLKKDNNNNNNNSIVNSLNSSLPLVPEIGVEENNSPDENDDEQFLYRVPVFDPLFFGGGGDSNNEIESFLNDEFIDSDAKLAELAADVENLLGSTTELDEDLAAAGVVSNNFIASDFMNNNRVKIEEDDEDEEVQAVIASHFDPALDSARESLSWDFDYSSSSPVIGGDEDLETKMMIELPENEFETKPEGMRKIFLKLNYDDIINTWDSQNCPWTNGTRPDFNCHDFVGNGCGTFEQAYGVGAGAAAGGGGRDEEREARVLRYKEKRRTRLFSKKIRYEVRKLNAEKRPRMKGRFVKRTSLLPGSSSSSSNNFPNYLINK